MEEEILTSLETPCVVLDYEKLEENIKLIQNKANQNNVSLRPHVKTHKCIEIAALQKQHGAVGITCAKISEAAEFIKQGFHSITVAYPIVDERKLLRFLQLCNEHSVELKLVVDSIVGLQRLINVTSEISLRQPIDVFLKIDVGLHRVGMREDDPQLIPLVSMLSKQSMLRFLGLLSHAGHAYAAKDSNAIEAIARDESEILKRVKFRIERELSPLVVSEVSVGSTPTVLASKDFSGITEIRPGNYVFMDRTQFSKGLIDYDQISLFVLATVVSFNEDYIIIDSGSKVLSSDMAPHGLNNTGLEGYGDVFTLKDWFSKRNKMILIKLSEEHGWIQNRFGLCEKNSIEIGSKVIVIPNHACPVVNLSKELVVIGKQENQNDNTHCSPLFWKVAAGGGVK